MSKLVYKTKKADKGAIIDKVTAIDFTAICPAFSKQELTDGQCKKCKKTAKNKALFSACSEASLTAKTAVIVKKSKVKRIATKVDSFGSRYNTNKHAYACLLYDSPEGITMKAVKSKLTAVNDGSRQPTFYCFTNKLVKQGFVSVTDKVISLTDKGRAAWTADIELKKAA